MCNFFLTSYSKPLTRSPNFIGKLALKRGKQLNIWVPDINNCEIHFYKFEKSDIKGLQDIIPFIESSDNGKTADKKDRCSRCFCRGTSAEDEHKLHLRV